MTDPNLHYEEEPSASFVAPEKPREVVFVDEFLGRVISIVKVRELRLETPARPATPKITFKADDPQTDESFELIGEGPSIGHCLRSILDQLNERIPLGGDDYGEQA